MIRGYAAKCQNPNCPGTVFLPVPSQSRSFEVRPYWPTGTWPLLFACPACGQGSVFAPSDFQLTMIPNPATEGSGTVWWSVAVQCSEESCGLPVTLHTVADADLPADDIARLLGPSFERFRCPSRHQLRAPMTILLAPVKIEFN
jgi:hypothetical protein